MNSKQEKIINTLSEKSLGAPFIFAPDEYKKGNATREPADLVWACNNCIFLFYMKSKEDKMGKEVAVLKRRKEKLIIDNIKQAKGWLSEWRNGRNLKGKNKFRSFDIDYKEYRNIVIIGLIDYGNEDGYYHQDYEKELDVRLCTTLSHRTFELLVSLDITAIDLILLILDLKERDLNGAPNVLLNIGLDYYNKAHQYAWESAKNLIPSVLPEKELLNTINRVFRELRSNLLLKIKSDHEEDNYTASIFNDISLKDYYQLVIVLSQRIKYHEEDPRRMIVYLQELENYIFIIGVSDIRNFHIMSENQFEAVRKLEELNLAKTLLMVAFDTLYYTFVFSFKSRLGKSFCEILLDSY